MAVVSTFDAGRPGSIYCEKGFNGRLVVGVDVDTQKLAGLALRDVRIAYLLKAVGEIR